MRETTRRVPVGESEMACGHREPPTNTPLLVCLMRVSGEEKRNARNIIKQPQRPIDAIAK